MSRELQEALREPVARWEHMSSAIGKEISGAETPTNRQRFIPHNIILNNERDINRIIYSESQKNLPSQGLLAIFPPSENF